MRVPELVFCVIALVLAQSPSFVFGHSNDEAIDTDKSGPEQLTPTNSSEQPFSYFADGTFTPLLILHAGIMVLAWVFILPIGVMFSISKSKLALPTRYCFLGLNAVALLFGIVYHAKTPDLYENNAHHKMGWVAMWVVSAQIVMSLLLTYSDRKATQASADAAERTAFLSEPAGEIVRWHEIKSNRAGAGRYLFKSLPDKLRFFRISPLLSKRVIFTMRVVCEIIDRLILIFGFSLIVTRGITYAGIMRGRAIFNGLAHFIKGGIFFWYGLLTLGRWMGAFSDLSWAWNIRPSHGVVSRWKTRISSGEFVESFVIFIYGSTNVFLEHLAGWGKEWTAMDLEHISISIIFFGGGLCGILIDSTTIRDCLNATISNLPPQPTNPFPAELKLRLAPKSYETPMNPMPGLVILLTGVMMSSRHQTSTTSTAVHRKWGDLLVAFALCRAVTYLTLYIAPPRSIYPSRPPSELVAGFCLISGGLLFMASTRSIVECIDAFDLDATLLFTVTMGLTAFLMAWEVVVLAIKG